MLFRSSLASMAVSCATALLAEKSFTDQAKGCRETANAEALKLHKAKAKVGRYGKCSIATAFVDTLTAGGLAKKTAQNYLSLFKTAVESGKPIADLGGTKSGGRKVTGKAPKQDRENPGMDALFKLMKTDEGLDILASIQMAYDDDEGSMIQIAIDMLKAEGFSIE